VQPLTRRTVSRRTVLAGTGAAAIAPALAAGPRRPVPRRVRRRPDALVRRAGHRLGEPGAAHRERHARRDDIRSAGTETIQFNEKTLWTAGRARPVRLRQLADAAARAIAGVQQAINERERWRRRRWPRRSGRPGPATAATRASATSRSAPARRPRPATGRELDIATAVARVSYTSGGVRHTREHFVSNPDRVIVVRLAADAPGTVGSPPRSPSPPTAPRRRRRGTAGSPRRERSPTTVSASRRRSRS
jgi:alpha-L-fucosidase 2